MDSNIGSDIIWYKGDAFLKFRDKTLVLNCFCTVLICFNKLCFAFIVPLYL